MNLCLPHLGEGIDVVELALWHVAPGDVVQEGDDLCEVTTDKASFNVAAERAGVVEKQCVKAGETVSVGAVLAVMKEEG